MEKILLHPKKLTQTYADQETRRIMEKTIEFFETKGLARIKHDDHQRVWYEDFLEFQKREQIFAKLFTPAGYGGPNARWDSSRIVDFAEILAFYGLCYWYTFQVSQLGLGPVFLGKNEEVKHRTSKLLKEGAIFAFGLSEKEHGADIYATDMMLYPQGGGAWRATLRLNHDGSTAHGYRQRHLALPDLREAGRQRPSAVYRRGPV